MSLPDPPRQKEIKGLLARARVIQGACDLDLLTFFYRHPRTLLTSEQLAGFVGYTLKDIARALEGFIEAGLLERTVQQAAHAARLFLLLLGGPGLKEVTTLVEIALTREGRRAILIALEAPRLPLNKPDTPPDMSLVRRR
ncbi:MAG: hypothetical protein ACXWWJ_07235 [Nitrospira sp.]